MSVSYVEKLEGSNWSRISLANVIKSLLVDLGRWMAGALLGRPVSGGALPALRQISDSLSGARDFFASDFKLSSDLLRSEPPAL